MDQLHRAHGFSADSLVPSTGRTYEGDAHPPSDTAFFDRVLDRIDPHHEPTAAALWNVQRICGRWLALRRIQHNMSLATLAGQVRLPAQTLRCLEEGAGLVGPQAIPERSWTRLASKLSFEHAEAAWIEQVIVHALGHVQSPNHGLMDRVLGDLDQLEALPLTQTESAVAPSPRQLPEGVRLDADIYALLDQIVSMPRHSIDLADRIEKDSATVNGLLVRMQAEGLITKDGQRIDPELDPDIALTYYRITAFGQRAYATERRVRDLEQQVQSGLPSTNFAPGM